MSPPVQCRRQRRSFERTHTLCFWSKWKNNHPSSCFLLLSLHDVTECLLPIVHHHHTHTTCLASFVRALAKLTLCCAANTIALAVRAFLFLVSLPSLWLSFFAPGQCEGHQDLAAEGGVKDSTAAVPSVVRVCALAWPGLPSCVCRCITQPLYLLVPRFSDETQEKGMVALTDKIVQVYVKCGFEPTAVPDPLAMLASIEVCAHGMQAACECLLFLCCKQHAFSFLSLSTLVITVGCCIAIMRLSCQHGCHMLLC